MRTRKQLVLSLMVLVLVLSGNRSEAQYNHVFAASWLGNFPMSGTALDIVEADATDQCVLSKIDDLIFSSFLVPEHLISLKKINMSGNTVWDRSYYFTDSFYELQPWRLIKTLDDGFIVVGRAIDVNASVYGPALANPFAFKVDQNGTMQWANIYKSNYVAYDDSIQTTITRIVDDTALTEEYMIVRSGSAAQHHEHTGDVCINALKIDVSGNLIWNKKYQLQHRNYEDSLVQDYPMTITHVPDSSNNGFYFIAGTRYNRNSSYNLRDSSLFMIGLDYNGNVVRNYRWMHVPGYPFNEDAIFDDDSSQNVVVMSYTHGNSGLVDPYLLSNRSQIGIMKVNKYLNINAMKYYWSGDLLENQAVRIKRNVLNDAYIVACNVMDSANQINNIGQLKVDKSLSSQYYYHYNVDRSSQVYGLYSSYDGGTGSEYYDMVGCRSSNVASLNDLRVMATDANGITCGDVSLNRSEDDYYDSLRQLSYAPIDTEGYFDILLTDADPYQDMYDCDPRTANNFREVHAMGISGALNSGLQVYPTLLDNRSNSVTIESSGDHPVYAALFAYDGRQIAEARFGPSKNVRWTLPQLSAGCYLLKVSAGNSNKSIKITRL